MKMRYLVFIPVAIACAASMLQTQATETFFIQLPLDVTVVKEMQEELRPVVYKLVEEISGIKHDPSLPIFFFKRRQAITVYYLNDVQKKGEKKLISTLCASTKGIAPQKVVLTSSLDFFGDISNSKKEAMLDLVALIEDPAGELSALNTITKEIAYDANNAYKKTHCKELYDIAKSERYTFKPHLGLGHLRIGIIREHIKDSARSDAIIAKLKEQLLETITTYLKKKITAENSKISSDKLNIYNFKTKEYISSCPLS